LQTKFNNILKRSYTMIKCYKDSSTYTTNDHNTAHKQSQGQKSLAHFNRLKKNSLTKFNIFVW
jgi:hypothetical protein